MDTAAGLVHDTELSRSQTGAAPTLAAARGGDVASMISGVVVREKNWPDAGA